MKYRPRTRPGFYTRTVDGERDIVRLDHVFDTTREGETSNRGTWWIHFIGTLTDFDKAGPSEYVQAASWEMRIHEFSSWRRWPKGKALPAAWAAFFDRNPA